MASEDKEKKEQEIKKDKKEKKYFGIMDFQENTNKWMTVIIVTLSFLLLINMAALVYKTYAEDGCGASGCAKTSEQEEDVLIKETGKKMVDTGEAYEVNGVTYKLHQLKETGEYALIGWSSVEEKGNKINEIIQGVQEKELIPTGEENTYIFVWGFLGTNLTVKENKKEVGSFEKEKNGVKIIEIKTENSKEITFE